MPDYVTLRRVTIVASSSLEHVVLPHLMELGATGYTLWECRGRGDRRMFDDPFSGLACVRIETIVQPHVADQIVDYLNSSRFSSQPLTVCVENVQVTAGQHF